MNDSSDIIEVKNLTKKFKDLTAVDGISFSVREGEVFGFLGPNGAGKTTTIKMLCTLLRPTSGQALVSGQDVVKSPSEVRKHIGLVAEKLILYDRLTAMENLKFFGSLYHIPKQEVVARATKWLKALEMEKWQDKMAGTFSTGMKQRVNIARALLTEPEVIFLDEPTLGLDPQTSRSIRNFIDDLHAHGVTVILTTHIMPEADELSDNIAIIDHGKIIAMDTPQNLKASIKKDNATLEDVFLRLTGRDMREDSHEHIPSARAHMFGGKSRVR
ncbi:ABC transporter ATP-binding protein [Patescibacteria group bacterium]|nr:ABC transporter ATP-binding protein [Patescibacteria group bacterium]MBU0964507.1 ABC transporter ATP-binding protein [Patescibacteria group bacterium]